MNLLHVNFVGCRITIFYKNFRDCYTVYKYLKLLLSGFQIITTITNQKSKNKVLLGFPLCDTLFQKFQSCHDGDIIFFKNIM